MSSILVKNKLFDVWFNLSEKEFLHLGYMLDDIENILNDSTAKFIK